MSNHNDPEDPTGDLANEIDVDLADDEDLDLPVMSEAILESAEYLGSYESISGYLRAMLEPEVTPACAWILDYLDYEAVRLRWESDGSRLVSDQGHIYRVAACPPEA